jgi:hypothetical protein
MLSDDVMMRSLVLSPGVFGSTHSLGIPQAEAEAEAEAEELPLSEAERCRQRLPTASPPPAVPPSQAGGNADDAASEESQARAHVSAAAAEVEQAVQQEAVEKAVQEAMQENSAAARVSTWAALASAMDGGGKFLFQLPLRFNDPIWIPIVDLN